MGYRVIHRRNNAAPGIGFLLAGLLILLSAFLPVIDFTGPTVGALAVTVTPKTSYSPDPIELWFWTGGFVFAFGLLLLATRIRGLGILWRIFAAIPVLIMAAYAGLAWYLLSDPQKILAPNANKNVGDSILQGIGSVLQNAGVISVSAGAGLILLTTAVLVGVLAIFLPSGKSQRFAGMPGAGPMAFGQNMPNQQQYPPQQYPPQQYPPQQYPPQQYPPSGP